MVRLEITPEADEADLMMKAIVKARDRLRATTTGLTARRYSEPPAAAPDGGMPGPRPTHATPGK